MRQRSSDSSFWPDYRVVKACSTARDVLQSSNGSNVPFALREFQEKDILEIVALQLKVFPPASPKLPAPLAQLVHALAWVRSRHAAQLWEH